MRSFIGRFLLAFMMVVVFAIVPRLAAQCTTQFNISVYSDGYADTDGLTVYGFSSTDDSSTLCTCVHSNYQTTAYLQLADGSYVNNTESGETSSVSSATDGAGSYFASGAVTLNCSCVGGLGGGGGSYSIPIINGIADSVTWSNTIYQGDSGYLAIFGSDLTGGGLYPTPTAIGDSDVTITFYWASDTQVNVSYTVAAGAGMGTHTLALQIPTGTPTGRVKVGPTITGASTVWWFNGESPAGYSTSITLTSSGGASTSWTAPQGGAKVNLSATSGASITVTSTGTSFSASAGDIHIVATANGAASKLFAITSRTPASASRTTVQTNCDATYGYVTYILYTILDQLYAALPSAIPVNEYWSTGISPDYTGTTWRRGSPNGITTVYPTYSQFSDMIQGEAAGYIPTPTCNGNSTPVQHWGQEWRIGSLTPGSGLLLLTDTLRKYIGYADHTY